MVEGRGSEFSYFHSVLKRRKSSNLLLHMEINGSLVDNDDDITAYVLDFYKNLFSKTIEDSVGLFFSGRC